MIGTRHLIYIAGPIAGHSNARTRFAAAEAHLRDQGWAPVNPFDVPPHGHPGPCPPGPDAGEGAEHTVPCHLRADLVQLLLCDAIYLLSGWEQSNGARTEFDVARASGLTIYYQDAREIERVNDGVTPMIGRLLCLVGVHQRSAEMVGCARCGFPWVRAS